MLHTVNNPKIKSSHLNQYIFIKIIMNKSYYKIVLNYKMKYAIFYLRIGFIYLAFLFKKSI